MAIEKEAMQVSVIIPTYNASGVLPGLLTKLQQQSVRNIELVVIDSSSSDNTVAIANMFGAKVISIPKEQFKHGGSRTLAGKSSKGDILCYFTQDALPVNEYSIERLTNVFRGDTTIAASFGRQVPYPDATPFSSHMRLFSYPQESHVMSIADKEKYGLRTVFISNSFAAYRRDGLEHSGWFKEAAFFGEDTLAAASLLMSGYKIAYISDALVYHSHNYTAWQEFKRYFDIGMFHAMEPWLITTFGKAEGIGRRYVISGLSFLLKERKGYLIPSFLFRNSMKFVGYTLGQNHRILPAFFRKHSA